ncbi:MAG: cytochrome c biogenesis protein CcdA [Bacteroidota bacterium]
MKKSIALLFLCCFSLFTSYAQLVDPVKWSYRIEQKGQEATLIFKASVEKGWHVYSQFLPDGGPIPTLFTFTPDKNYTLVGKVTEPKGEEVFDPNFEIKLKFFENVAEFKQKIKLNSNKAFKLKGMVESMACNDKNCTPPNAVDFEFAIAGEETSEVMNPATSTSTIENDSVQKLTESLPTAAANSKIPLPSGDITKLEPSCDNGAVAHSEDKSYWGIFIAGMLGGFLALLTPCVFPMIPMTVSFFTKRSPTRAKGIRNAVIYALSIILIYVTIGFFVTVTLGSDALNDLASSVFFNLLFFIIFFVFALSFLGAFEIVLPSSWVNKADSASDKGGLVGIFFMAFTLSLVSFSCTGPIIGTLLVEAAKGSSYLGPIMGMTGFSAALALPFALFAAFPGWLNTLPKSGGWLNSVKVVLGFLELALALKFLSNVDLAYHWGFLKRELFIALWITIFGLMSLYLIGKLKFSHDSDLPYIGTTRIIFAIIAIAFTFYLIPGLWGAPLRLISGFPPPEFYKEWEQPSAGVEQGKGGESCPHNLNCYHDYEAGMAYAKSIGKPVMIDFTGWSCVNCRKMEDNVWSQTKVLKHLSDDYVVISLYVDDKTELPANEQYISKFSGKKIRTTGNKWSDMEAAVLNKNVQPYYVLVDNEGKMLAEPRSYTPNVDEYTKFLEEGLCRYKIRSNQ